MHRFSAIAAIALVACAATSLCLWRELRTERERAEALQTRLVQLERSQAAKAKAKTAIDVHATQPAVSPTPPQETTKAKPAGAKPQNTQRRLAGLFDMDSYERQERRLLQDPQYREARRAQRRLEMTSGHLDLTSALQISPETADQLISLLVDEELQYLSEPHPNPTNDEEYRARQLEIEKSERARDAKLSALLGESKLAEWKEYQASLQTRYQVHQLRGTLSASPDPLRDDQMEPLISAIYTEQKQLNEEMRAYAQTLDWSEDTRQQSFLKRKQQYADRSSAAKDRIHTAAASILSQRQLASLDDMVQRRLDLEAAQMRRQKSISVRSESNPAQTN